jgi:uncharacterized protein YyaL (SSP411 family)
VRAAALALLAVGCLSPSRSGAPRLPEPTARSTAEIRRDGNHLAGEASPYLLQHAHNPVDWYPWGPEALERARRLDRPIFLSIGYSTCHWCHVMEEESFEDDEVARELNAHFVAIKVDREQRPDLDALMLDAVGALGSRTGWPLTVFLTPDLEPFFGGTYFPRDGRGGRPGFLDLLREIRRLHREERAAMATRGRQLLERLQTQARPAGPDVPLTADVPARAFARLARARDSQLGGFGRGTKFPNAPLLLAELRQYVRSRDAAAGDHLVLTLEQMARGGLRDHLGGTFHRYAVDRRWHLPHFEKTLYDNAQLGRLYVEAGRVLGRPDFVAVGRAVLDDLVARWQGEDGGFVVGFDADDAGGEGAYYTWTVSELTAALGETDGSRFAVLHGVTDGGEAELGGRGVLHRIAPDEAERILGLDPAAAEAFVASVRPRLLAVRAERPAPAVDDKELTAWTALAVESLALVGRWLGVPAYLDAASRGARFLLEQGRDGDRVLRGRRRGVSLGAGFLDDHAFTVRALLRLHEADGDPAWLEAAMELGRVMVDRHWDPEVRAFVQRAEAEAGADGLPLRLPRLDDGVLPAGGTAAIAAVLELGRLSGDPALLSLGRTALRAAAPRLEEPSRAGFLLQVALAEVGTRREAVLAGDRTAPGWGGLYQVLRDVGPEDALLALLPGGGASPALAEAYPALRDKVAAAGTPTAYVCELGRCELPTRDPATLMRQLEGRPLGEAPPRAVEAAP